MKKATVILIVLLLFTLTACKDRNDITATATAAAETAVIPVELVKLQNADPYQNFSYNSASLILSQETGNANYSPMSVYFALALAATGSKGQTQNELLALLNADDIQKLSTQCSDLYKLLCYEDANTKIALANSVWLDKKYKLKNDFQNNAGSMFNASFHSINYQDKEAAGKAIGDWIAENTRGTLTPEIEISDTRIMDIINTLYYYNEWAVKFDKEKTSDDLFHVTNNNDITVPFMNITFSQEFYDGNGFLRSSVGLKRGDRMVFILPDQGTDINTLLNKPEKLQELFEGGEKHNGEVVFKIPKFSFNGSYKDSLKKLGIPTAFNHADFTGITDAASFISEAIHETHISLDENGVTASAYTDIQLAGGYPINGDKAEMILERPFIYGIESRGKLLFVGVVKNPKV